MCWRVRLGGRARTVGSRLVIDQRPSVLNAQIEALAPAEIDDAFGRATTAELLVQGGDSRLNLDPLTGANRYGCAPRPNPRLADFASSTASVISARGYDAADALHARLGAEPLADRPVVYARELERIRGELKALCGLGDRADVDVIFAASGTDLHLLARELVGGTPTAPLLCVGVEPEETGSGVPAALAGRHFSNRAALGEAVDPGGALGPGGGEYIAVPARSADGGLRDGAAIEADLDAIGLGAARAGRRVLLSVADVSKTGLISPGLDTVLALRRRFPNTIEVLIDACQFRLSAASLRAYLDQDLMVAVTGSKFLTGPVFSGALFVPAAVALRLSGRLPRPALRAYSARADWPETWVAGKALNEAANEGLLLRWEAALAELRAFRAVPEIEVERFVTSFAKAVQTRLAEDPMFEPLAARPLDRAAIGAAGGWDQAATIFPFLLRDPSRVGGPLLSVAAVEAVYRCLMTEAADGPAVRLGQPVPCGRRGGAPLSALRLCNSARLTVEGASDPEPVIRRALAVLDRTAATARRLVEAGSVHG
jgi:hypothetical protein